MTPSLIGWLAVAAAVQTAPQTLPPSQPFAHVLPAGPHGMGWRVPAVSDPRIADRCERIYDVTQRLARHLDEDPALLLATVSKSTEPFIRPNTGIVCGLSFLYRFGPYDEAEAGISRERLLREKILPMIGYLTQTHVTGPRATSDGKKWGDAWQSAHWVRALGRAAWFLGPDLPEDLAVQVRKVVAHEADRIASMEPPHQVRSDTKAEENAWNSGVLSAAAVLMPEHPRRPVWEKAFQKWALSSYLRPADQRSDKIVDGWPLAEQFTGANIYDDYTLENHDIVHPDYMTTFSLLLGSALDYAMTGRAMPKALLHNVPGIYENLKWFALPDGGFVYPSGQDWGLFRNPDWLNPHVCMAVFAGDPQAWELADRSLVTTEKMQARAQGAIFLPEENFFSSAHADKLYMFGTAWLMLHYAKHGPPEDLRRASAERRGVRHLESARIVLNRTPTAVHTLSWGTGVMAQCLPYRLDRIVSPHLRSGIGSIVAAGDVKPLPVKLVEAKVDAGTQAFTAELVVTHGDQVRAHLRFASHSDGRWEMSERLVALKDVRLSQVTTGLVGVLNNRRWIHERGERRMAMDDEQVTIASCSGQRLQRSGIRQVTIDSVLTVSSAKPLSILYQAATQPERSRVTDELYLNVLEGERAWRADDVISEHELAMRCTAEP
ncbi:MAG: hypothetical protein AMXMBFR13_38810 [Phycisphaerae bacterium]